MDKFDSLVQFCIQLDDMKTILRQTKVIRTQNREDDAQHSFHISAMAVLFRDYAPQPIDLERVLKMLLFHDVVELEAGDTFCYDTELQVGKNEREEEAARKLFGSLPSSLGEDVLSLWHDFEEGTTNEARYAVALDRIQPLFNNYYGGGGSWIEHGVRYSQVLERIHPAKLGCPALYDYAMDLLKEAVGRGWLINK